MTFHTQLGGLNMIANFNDPLEEEFLGIDLWQDVLNKAISKGINTSVISSFSQPQGRIGLWEMLTDYEWSIPRIQRIPKDNGKFREVQILDDVDRCLMSAITQIYTKRFGHLIPEVCKSYQKGVSVKSIVEPLKNLQVTKLIKVDLKSYFDSVPIEVIEYWLREMDCKSRIDTALWNYYHDNRVINRGAVVEHYKSLGQGCAFSSLLANLCISRIDKEIAERAKLYIRYSDDILIGGDNADELLLLLREALDKLGLCLNEKKTTFCDINDFEFLGCRITHGDILFAGKTKAKFKSIVKNCCRKAKGKDKRQKQINAIKKIKHELFKKDSKGNSLFSYYASLITPIDEFRWLNTYCESSIRAIYTGHHNYTTNKNKTPDKWLEENGWLNLVSLFNLYNYNKRLGQLAVTQGRYVEGSHDCKHEDLLILLERLWPTAKILMIHDECFHSAEELVCAKANYKQFWKLIKESQWIWDGFYLQSKKYKELVILKDWFTKGDK